MAAAVEKLQQNLGGVDLKLFDEAVEAESRRRLGNFADGVKAYQTLSRPPRPDDVPTIWQQGTTRLLDYGATHDTAKDGPPILCVPSLINRAYVLDLTRQRSLMRDLAKQGFRPLLVDWDGPGPAEQGYSLSDYIGGRLESALDAATEITGRPVTVLGYCMGGLLALALAQRKPDQVAALALLATPWDFHAPDAAAVRMLRAVAPQLAVMIDTLGLMPVDMLQAMFASLDPTMAIRKFQAFARLDKRSAKARHFIALEDWLNDGVPLTGPVARECLFDWYLGNTPARGTWSVKDRPVRPEEVTTPTLAIIPEQDYIVPPESAAPLAALLPKVESRVVAAGHIGMVVGSRGPTLLYPLLGDWFRDHLR
ncbi:MAG: alpha/beta fold hydrolase [Rhodospirillales bacterium]|nr:alpha/beta fold hydrolase [Rhodospirillales bacterium]